MPQLQAQEPRQRRQAGASWQLLALGQFKLLQLAQLGELAVAVGCIAGASKAQAGQLAQRRHLEQAG